MAFMLINMYVVMNGGSNVWLLSCFKMVCLCDKWPLILEMYFGSWVRIWNAFVGCVGA